MINFNLHYFDWSRNWLTDILLNNRNKYTSCFPELVDNWIDNNPLAEGDGWHSYTISLRIRNWILWLRFLPDLATKKRIESLSQIHKENLMGIFNYSSLSNKLEKLI